MLGRVRRTTRTDVGLAISFCGVAYLVWALVAGVARHVANEVSGLVHDKVIMPFADLPAATVWLCGVFIRGAVFFDILGVLWLVLSLVLIVGASRQRWSISWAWMCAICQTMAAAALAVWAGLAGRGPFTGHAVLHGPPAYATAGWTLLSVAVAVALVLWVGVLVWLLYERARLGRGPSLRDGLRTHVPG